jgi:hypothetical protein
LFKDSLQTREILGVVLDLFMFEVPGMDGMGRFLWWGQRIINHWQGEPEFMDSQIVR